MEVAALLCPACKAPLPPEAARATVTCRFCRVTVQPAAPKVVERVVEVAIPVPVQVEARALSPDAPRAVLNCPRCHVPLFETHAHEVVLAGCPGCGGIWLDNDSSKRITECIDRQVEELVARAARNAKVHPDTAKTDLPCASCRASMQRVRAPGMSVDLDVCAEHGTWFDAREVTLVMEGLAARRTDRAIADAMSVTPANTPSFSTGASTAANVAAVALGVLGGILSASAKP